MSEVADEASIVQRLGSGTSDEIPTMDPHHDRQWLPQWGAEVHVHRDKDVEVEAVLTDLLGNIGDHCFNSLKMNISSVLTFSCYFVYFVANLEI